MLSWIGKWCCRYRAERWDSPLENCTDLEFVGMWVGDTIHFWFVSKETLFSMKIPRRSPFRIVDESYLSFLQRYLKGMGRTWKVFGTPFVRDLEATILFQDTQPQSRFAYLVVTRDECVEFVCGAPEFEKHPIEKLSEITRKVSD